MAQAKQGNSTSSAAQSKSAEDTQSAHPFADKIKDTLHQSVDTLSEKAVEAEKGIREKASKGSENIEEQRSQAESSWNKSSVKRYAVENPVATAGIAFAAGALLASFFRSK
jgi:hypothetical protein